MPTGYTAYIEDGSITTGKEFLMLCLRNFGISIDIRDEPLSVPTPTHFEPNPYYKESYESAVKHLEEVKSLDFESAKLRRRLKHEHDISSAERAIERMREINRRYHMVRNQVDAWVPPDSSYDGVKKFALEQIDMCIYDDDMFSFYQKIIDEPFDDCDDATKKYLDKMVEFAENSVKEKKRDYDAEIQRAKDKEQFMKAFVDSLEAIG